MFNYQSVFSMINHPSILGYPHDYGNHQTKCWQRTKDVTKYHEVRHSRAIFCCGNPSHGCVTAGEGEGEERSPHLPQRVGHYRTLVHGVGRIEDLRMYDISHRIHGAAIYGNIYHQNAPFMLPYMPYMEHMGSERICLWILRDPHSDITGYNWIINIGSYWIYLIYLTKRAVHCHFSSRWVRWVISRSLSKEEEREALRKAAQIGFLGEPR